MEFKDLRNESGLEFTDISVEEKRVYYKNGSVVLVVNNPIALNVSSSGGHRILDGEFTCHYLKPEAWDRITWLVKIGLPHFVK